MAYGALGYQGYENPSFLSTPGAKDVGIEFYTFSKTFNMAGWRLAFAAGNDQMIEALNLIQDHLFVGIFPALSYHNCGTYKRYSSGDGVGGSFSGLW